MKNLKKSPLAVAMGSLVISGFTATVNAESNPFALVEMSSPYMQLAAADTLNNKVSEGGCASAANPPKKATAEKSSEATCGEGKCGAMMSGSKMKPGMEHSCGAMMKGKDGSCGMNMSHDGGAVKSKADEGSCGAMMKNGEGSCGAKVDSNQAAGK